jgi:hypothetical protein
MRTFAPVPAARGDANKPARPASARFSTRREMVGGVLERLGRCGLRRLKRVRHSAAR